jgi:hypothetical protein
MDISQAAIETKPSCWWKRMCRITSPKKVSKLDIMKIRVCTRIYSQRDIYLPPSGSVSMA